MPSNRQKNKERMWKEKVKSFLCKPELHKQNNVLHLDQETAKCTACERICGKFYLLKARQLIIRKQLNYQNAFLAKFPGVYRVNED